MLREKEAVWAPFQLSNVMRISSTILGSFPVFLSIPDFLMMKLFDPFRFPYNPLG